MRNGLKNFIIIGLGLIIGHSFSRSINKTADSKPTAETKPVKRQDDGILISLSIEPSAKTRKTVSEDKPKEKDTFKKHRIRHYQKLAWLRTKRKEWRSLNSQQLYREIDEVLKDLRLQKHPALRRESLITLKSIFPRIDSATRKSILTKFHTRDIASANLTDREWLESMVER